MKLIFTILIIVVSLPLLGQNHIDNRLRIDPFLGRLYDPNAYVFARLSTNPYACFLEDGSGFFTDVVGHSDSTKSLYPCFLEQGLYLDSLRSKFNDEELLEIAKSSTLPFYRVAAFKLYSEIDYNIDTMEKFLEEEVLSSQLGTMISFSWHSNHNEFKKNGVPKGYKENPTYNHELIPSWKSIVDYMLQKVSPNKSSDSSCIDSAKTIGLEKYVFLQSLSKYVPSFGITSLDYRSFLLEKYNQDFGVIYLTSSDKSKFELKSQFQIHNPTNDTIRIKAKINAHTECNKSEYVIPPKGIITVEYRSLVNLKHINSASGKLDRTITFQNLATGEEQDLKVMAQFQNSKIE